MYLTYMNVYGHVGTSDCVGSFLQQTCQKHFNLTNPPSIEHGWRPGINQGDESVEEPQ